MKAKIIINKEIMQKKKYKQIDIKQKHLNLIAYLINQFAVDSLDKDFLNVVDTKTQKRTEDFEHLNPSNIDVLQEDKEYIENSCRAFTTILAVEELRKRLDLNKELFTEEYFDNLKYARKNLDWVKQIT